MKILVDADSCPVLEIVEEVAREYKCKLLIYANLNHQLISDYGQVKKVDSEYQSVDMELYNDVQKGDIVITQDYGLACLVLGKNAEVISPRGQIFTDSNIQGFLWQRHQHARIRRATGRQTTHHKRTDEDDELFYQQFIRLIKNNVY